MSCRFGWPAQPFHRIAIIGVGQVGSAAAYGLIFSPVAKELLLVDIDTDLRDGQVHDLSDAAYSYNRGTSVRAANYRDASQCDIIVLTAGSKHTFGETTLDHLYRNISIVRNVLKAITPLRPDSVLVVASNPCDLLTSLAQKLSGLPAAQVIGVGTCLDSLRLRGLISDHTEVAANSVRIDVLGVQGPTEVVAWSTATVGGIPLQDWCKTQRPINVVDLKEECFLRSQSIFRAKGSTPFGVGSVIRGICESIVLDQRDIQPVSHFQPDHGCCFSLPAVLGRKGIISTVVIPLNANETSELAESVADVRTLLDRIKQDDEARAGIGYV